MRTHTIVIYHANCQDGQASAYAAWKNLGDEGVQYLAYHYSNPPPEDLKGKDVYILDFSFPKAILKTMAKKARTLVLIDHHKTTFDDLGYEGFEKYIGLHEDISVVLDKNKSGCVLAWEFFNSALPVPKLLLHVQDRDLWRWELENTKEICLGLAFKVPTCDPETFPLLSVVNEIDLLRIGQILSQQQEISLAIALKRSHKADINSLETLACNASSELASELGNRLAKETGTFGVVYSYDGGSKLWLYSLRSIGDFDVSEIAKEFGGGGHRNAAGFSLHFNLFEE